MGVLNVTPDSFSDGGVHLARRGGGRGGAAGCSTPARRSSTSAASRPGPARSGVALEEELRRVEPVLEALAGAPVSIDTSKAEVARRALELGAELVNDVTALRGDAGARGRRRGGGRVPLPDAHARRAADDAGDPVYDDVVSEVKAFLEERLAFAVAAGIREELVCLDPGIGFGKTVEHNFELVRRLDELRRARPAGARRLLAQELARPDRWATRRATTGHRSRRRSGRRSRRSTGARRSCAPTTCASTSRRCAAARAVAAMKIELRGLELHGHHGVTEEERDRARVPLRRRARGGRARRERPASRTRSTTARSPATVREVNERQFRLLEALAAAIADTLLERFAGRARQRARAQAGGPPGRARRSSSQRRHASSGRDARVRRARREPRRPRGAIRRAAELIGATPALDDPRDRAVGLRRPAAGS